MNQNVKAFLKAELNVAYQYLERSYFVVSSNLSIKSNLNIRTNIEKFYLSTESIISELVSIEKQSSNIEANDYKLLIKYSYNLINSLLDLNIDEDKYLPSIKRLFEAYYDQAYYFHVISLDQRELTVIPPRSHLASVNIDSEAEGKEVKSYQIDWEILEDIKDTKNLFISSLEDKRENYYEQFVLEGHDYIYKKEYNKALDSFKRARNYTENAEILNLIGWTYSFLDQLDVAQKFALKAIRKDPDYGASYNDLGSYLMSEDKVTEALEWFKMAKNASNYQNREYPYINSGRAYLMLKDYNKALEEFSYALSLAPYHEELHETVTNLQNTIDKSKHKLEAKVDSLEDHAPIF